MSEYVDRDGRAQERGEAGLRVLIAGGGYAGLSCAIDVCRHAPGAAVHLIDPSPAHLKLAHLHEAFLRPLERLCVPFDELAGQYGFVHEQGRLGEDGAGAFDEASLREWQRTRRAPVRSQSGETRLLGFDVLVVATGGHPRLPAPADEARCLDLVQLRKLEGESVLDRLSAGARDAYVTVVGSGATGIQYIFALREALRRRRLPHRLRLVSNDRQPLAQQPEAVREYVAGRLAAAGIESVFQHAFVGQRGSAMRLRAASGDALELPSDLSLLFGGVRPHPVQLHTDRFGRVVAGGAMLPSIFAAGDCAHYAAPGLNAPSAQAAIRKGRLAAANLLRHLRARPLLPYRYRELGYVVSLGEHDAAGWVGTHTASISGAAAAILKQAVEAQYDLFVGGIDTYIG